MRPGKRSPLAILGLVLIIGATVSYGAAAAPPDAEGSQSGNPTGADCAPAPSPCTGFEGIQIFDISNLNDIKLVTSVALDCGSHTHTVVPDPENDRVLIYNSVSGNTLQANPGKCGNRCPGPPFNHEDIVEVPLSDPASAHVLGSFDLGEHEGMPVEICHGFGVILGDVNRGACAGHGISVFDLTDPANRCTCTRRRADGRSLPLGRVHMGRLYHRLRLGARAAAPSRAARRPALPSAADWSRPRR